MRIVIGQLLVLLTSVSAFSINIDSETPRHLYDFEEENVINYCWKEQQKISELDYPSNWEDMSALYLVYEDYYEAKKMVGRGRGISYLGHRMIKILDQAGIENFSEIYYTKRSKVYYAHRQKDYFGVKVIKSNGKEIIIDNKNIIKDENGDKKLAVTNLEIGDIIDYYIFTYDYASDVYDNFAAVIDKFPVKSKYPIRQFDYKVVTDANWNVKFTTGLNGYEIVEKKTGYKNRDYSFSINQKFIDGVKTNLWDYPYMTLPYVKLYVFYEKGYLSGKEKIAHSNWRTSELDPNKIVDHYKPYYKKDNQASNEYRSFLGYLKKAGKKDLSDEKFLEEYYYFIRHHFMNMHLVYDEFGNKKWRKVNSLVFTGHIVYALIDRKIPYDIIVVYPRSSGRMSDVLDVNETDYIIRANLKQPVYFYKPTPFTAFNILPPSIESAEGYVVQSPNNKVKNLQVEKIDLPQSDYASNLIEYVSDIKFDKQDLTQLITSNTTTYYGHQMNEYKFPLTDWINMTWEENEKYKTKRWGDPANASGNDKVMFEEFVERNKEIRKKNFEYIAKTHYETEELELLDYESYTTGNQVDDSALKVRFNCKLSDYVKKVGPNYVLKVGKLFGGQLTIDDDNKERDNDVYMIYARGYKYNVKIDIPEGYEVKGIENLNLNIDNKTGRLVTTAVMNENTLILSFEKIYKNNFEKMEDWPLMKEFLIPASQFENKEILLKKI